MKHIRLVITLLILGFAVNAFAQLSAGPELGINIIPLGKDSVKQNYQLGVHAGIAIEYRFNKTLSLSTGLFYEQKKKSYSSETKSTFISQFSSLFFLLNVDESYVDSLIHAAGINDTVFAKTNGMQTQSYIELPLLFHATYKNVNLFIGPYAGIMVGARQKEVTITTVPFSKAIDPGTLLSAANLSALDSLGLFSSLLPPAEKTVKNETSTTDKLNLFDYGAIAGIGYTAKNVKFNLCYTYGFADYRKDRGSDKKSTHQSVRIYISYLFGLTKKKSNLPSNNL